MAITIKNDLTNSLLEDQNQNGVEMDVVNAANELKSQLFDMLLLTLTSENNDLTRKFKKKFNKQIKDFKTNNKDKFNKNKTLDLTITNVIDLVADGNDTEEEEEEFNL